MVLPRRERVEDPLSYQGVNVLAPMVRACTLPLRLECLRYGADLVFGEEIIDKKLAKCRRYVNNDFGTVEYVLPDEKQLVYSTCAEEKGRNVFQLGTASGVIAWQAAQVVARDVAAFDVNMGCPKSFSVKGGMGAALLSTPEIATDILKTLRRNLPAETPVTCKIRLLGDSEPDIQRTIEFMKGCEQTGVKAITVHCRTKPERPAHPAHWNCFAPLREAVQCPVLLNGDIFTHDAIRRMEEHVKCDGIMFARGALRNPAIFDYSRDYDKLEVVQSYIRTAIQCGTPYQNTKWVLSQVIGEDATFMGQSVKTFQQTLAQCKSMKQLCDLHNMDHVPEKYPANAHSIHYYKQMTFKRDRDEEEGDGEENAPKRVAASGGEVPKPLAAEVAQTTEEPVRTSAEILKDAPVREAEKVAATEGSEATVSNEKGEPSVPTEKVAETGSAETENVVVNEGA